MIHVLETVLIYSTFFPFLE